MKRRTRFFSLLLFCVLAVSCQDPKIPTDKYFEGKVILRAEKNSPLGLIRLINIYGKGKKTDPHMDDPRMAVVYRFADSDDKFDLGEKVYLTIGERNGVQVACDILSARKGYSNIELFDISEKHQYIQHVDMNLHNADHHREGPKHKKVYTDMGAVQSLTGLPIGKIVVTVLDGPASGGVSSIDSFYVELSENIELNTEYYTQYSKKIAGYDVHTFDLEHIH